MADPYYANVALLLPMNGDNNGTVFTDYSPTPKTITRYGDTKTVTAQSQYYGSSGYFDGTGDYLTVPSTGFTMPGDFTVEGWVRILASQYHSLFDCRSGANFSDFETGIYPISGGLRLDMVFGGNVRLTGSTTTVPLTTWAHVAWMRKDGVVYVYVNGVKDATTLSLSRTITPANATMRIGSGIDPVPTYGNGNDWRITIGTARYDVAGFTPPAMLASPISGTILDTAGLPCSRTVHLFDRASGTKLGTTVSDASTGQYTLYAPPSGNEVIRVVLADEPALYNDIVDQILPA